jgi:hypothetical protein
VGTEEEPVTGGPAVERCVSVVAIPPGIQGAWEACRTSQEQD